MIIKNAVLETVCGITSILPKNEGPEFVFAGKSNVGKSSLINALLNRKALARTSQAPGKTQTINFYKINDAFYFVDLPGYGFAKVGEEIKAKWGRMIENYLHTSEQIKAVLLLVDIRHEPGENDKKMYEWILHQGFRPIIVATKSDKIKRSQLQKHIRMLKTGLQCETDAKVFPFSASTKQGREELHAFMEEMLKEKTGPETKTLSSALP